MEPLQWQSSGLYSGFYSEEREAQPVLTKKFLQQTKTAAMCMALCDYTHHRFFISPFLLVSSKWIVTTDNMQHRDEYACCQLVKGLPSDSVAQLVRAW